LDEYQREQEMEVPDTVASKALYFLHHVDPHKFTNAVIGINAGHFYYLIPMVMMIDSVLSVYEIVLVQRLHPLRACVIFFSIVNNIYDKYDDDSDDDHHSYDDDVCFYQVSLQSSLL